jgi:hypothetical protein
VFRQRISESQTIWLVRCRGERGGGGQRVRRPITSYAILQRFILMEVRQYTTQTIYWPWIVHYSPLRHRRHTSVRCRRSFVISLRITRDASTALRRKSTDWLDAANPRGPAACIFTLEERFTLFFRPSYVAGTEKYSVRCASLVRIRRRNLSQIVVGG